MVDIPSLVDRYRRWLQNTGFDGNPNNPPMAALAAMTAQQADIDRLREALTKIAEQDGDGLETYTPQAMVAIALDALAPKP